MFSRKAHVVKWLLSQKMGTTTRAQMLGEFICISNARIFFYLKIKAKIEQSGLFNLGIAKENSELQSVQLRLKIDLVSHLARTEGLDKYKYGI